MSIFVPVNLSVAHTRADGGLLLDAAPIAVPGVDQLDNWAHESYSLTIDAATRVGFPVGTVAAEDKCQVLLFGSSRWKDVTEGSHTYRFGVALRALIVVTDIKVSGELTLPVVAAKVETEGARARAQLLVRGYKGSNLAELFPTWQSFGVDAYREYMTAVSNIQKQILEDKANIEPELLATTVLSPQQPSDGIHIRTHWQEWFGLSPFAWS